MNSSIFIQYILAGLFILLIGACEKTGVNKRNTYTGYWMFEVVRITFNVDSVGQYEKDTVLSIGIISMGERNNEISIQYTPENNILLNVDKEGELSGFPTNYCSGQFENDDVLNLYLRWGGLGGGISHDIHGQKTIIP